jgi:hypothetical protein
VCFVKYLVPFVVKFSFTFKSRRSIVSHVVLSVKNSHSEGSHMALTGWKAGTFVCMQGRVKRHLRIFSL